MEHLNLILSFKRLFVHISLFDVTSYSEQILGKGKGIAIRISIAHDNIKQFLSKVPKTTDIVKHRIGMYLR